MPQVKMRIVNDFGRVGSDDDPLVMMILDFYPRGSGNKRRIRDLAAAFKAHETIGPHVVKVVCASSRLKVYYRPSLGLISAVLKCARAVEERRSDEGQGVLFPGV